MVIREIGRSRADARICEFPGKKLGNPEIRISELRRRVFREIQETRVLATSC